MLIKPILILRIKLLALVMGGSCLHSMYRGVRPLLRVHAGSKQIARRMARPQQQEVSPRIAGHEHAEEQSCFTTSLTWGMFVGGAAFLAFCWHSRDKDLLQAPKLQFLESKFLHEFLGDADLIMESKIPSQAPLKEQYSVSELKVFQAFWNAYRKLSQSKRQLVYLNFIQVFQSIDWQVVQTPQEQANVLSKMFAMSFRQCQEKEVVLAGCDADKVNALYADLSQIAQWRLHHNLLDAMHRDQAKMLSAEQRGVVCGVTYTQLVCCSKHFPLTSTACQLDL